LTSNVQRWNDHEREIAFGDSHIHANTVFFREGRVSGLQFGPARSFECA